MNCCRLIDRKSERRYDDCIKYTMVASKKALADAGLSNTEDEEAFNKLDKARVGVLVGSGMGGLQVFQDGVTNLVQKVRVLSPTWCKRYLRKVRFPSPTWCRRCVFSSPLITALQVFQHGVTNLVEKVRCCQH